MLFLTGSYTDPHGEGLGVALLDLGGDAGAARTRQLSPAESPSWVDQHPHLDLLYVVEEHEGRVVALRGALDAGAPLERLEPARAVGAAACHVRVADNGSHLVTTSWGEGTVTLIPLDEQGALGEPEYGIPSTDPHQAAGERQSRAHCSIAIPPHWALADGRDDLVLTTDLGHDILRLWSTGDGLTLEREIALPEGCGPRHMALGPSDHLYVCTEYSVDVVVLDSALEVAALTPALGHAPTDGDTAAEITVDPSGRWVSVGVRGSDVIAVLEIHSEGGMLSARRSASCGGSIPRHHAHLADRVLVANQGSSTITELPFDPATGEVGAPSRTIAVGTPTQVLPLDKLS